MLRPQAGRAVARATRGKRSPVKRVNHVCRAGAKTYMSPTWGYCSLSTQIDPELRIFLAKPNGCRPDFEFTERDGREQRFIEARCCRYIPYHHRNVINHAGAPDFTSLKMMESLKA
jgi:hypothetical protein